MRPHLQLGRGTWVIFDNGYMRLIVGLPFLVSLQVEYPVNIGPLYLSIGLVSIYYRYFDVLR